MRRNGDGRYTIISGERRWRAAQRADLRHLPAYIREADDENLHAMALVENIQREDLNAIEIALGMQRLIDECHLTQDALSEKMGKKRSTVANYIRLLKLPDEVQYALKEGLISMGHAKAIAAAPEEHRLRVLKRCVRKGLSVRQTESWPAACAPWPKRRPTPRRQARRRNIPNPTPAWSSSSNGSSRTRSPSAAPKTAAAASSSGSRTTPRSNSSSDVSPHADAASDETKAVATLLMLCTALTCAAQGGVQIRRGPRTLVRGGTLSRPDTSRALRSRRSRPPQVPHRPA